MKTPFEIRRELDQREKDRLAPLACASMSAERRVEDPTASQGHRQEFSVDADRILHSLSYTRYIDKTQVFSLVDNDHITHRVLHVQLVSKIARTIGRMLGLNEDLIEAIALGHDIGHPPFGHDGERFLSVECQEHGLGPFFHNVQSVRFLERVEGKGRGLNLTLQVLDGILCHDGEADLTVLQPMRAKDFAFFDRELAEASEGRARPGPPMTLEGCVVRLADTIAYIGRDIEDAIRLGLITRGDLPAEATSVLGSSNGTIVYRLVEDLVSASLGQDRVGFSPEVGRSLISLKQFNLQRVYLHPDIKTEHGKIQEAYHRLFDSYAHDVELNKKESPIVGGFLERMNEAYRANHRPAEVARDYIAGMTDQFFLNAYKELVWPRRLSYNLKGLE